MLYSHVRRFTAAVALVLVVAAAPALAAPGPRPHATQTPVASLSLLDRLMDWLGLTAAEELPGRPGGYEKSTTTTAVSPSGSSDTRAALSRGTMIDPNG